MQIIMGKKDKKGTNFDPTPWLERTSHADILQTVGLLCTPYST
jgi:hypothetical protein